MRGWGALGAEGADGSGVRSGDPIDVCASVCSGAEAIRKDAIATALNFVDRTARIAS